ncbi:MAG: DUF2339 domain-containing protein [Candidatus Eisenbacteria bacterium]|nr:DUF2339 domain-containing protein [Candidatus Eisenbacteria bacterium]
MWPFGVFTSLVLLIVALWVIGQVRSQRDELRSLRQRLDALERQGAASPAASVPATSAVSEPIVSAPAAPPAPVLAARGFDSMRAEELIGSVWLQNVGAVLLLLGVFFMILWGYTNGRIGPEVLVGAGVGLGAAVMWRGDRVARRVPAFGHALIGVGLGTAYLSLYLGHFTLHVMSPWAAYAALALLSIAAVMVGLRYRVETIAALGVVGAFVPQIMAAWIPLHGLSMSPASLLGYMGLIDAAVFVLAARAGWTSLSLAALALTAVTWIAGAKLETWGWGMESALVLLFTGLGLSPVPRFARRPVPIPAVDLAVVALAPLALIACSWPMLAVAGRLAVAVMMLALAIAYLVAALWVDARRETQDLWRPLTGAAIVFGTTALERALGSVNTPMGWCIEGTLLLWIGLRPRGGWLRFCGSMVTALGLVAMLADLFSGGGWTLGDPPAFYPSGMRDLVCLLAVLTGAALIGRARVGAAERLLGHVWTATGHVLLATWLCREAGHVAQSFASPGGRWYRVPESVGAQDDQRLTGWTFALTAAAWLVQAATLIESGLRGGRLFHRAAGYVLALIATFTLFLGIQFDGGWSRDQLPIVHPIGLVRLAGIALLYACGARLAGARSRLGASERVVPDLWTTIASLTLLGWIGAEAVLLARRFARVPDATDIPRGMAQNAVLAQRLDPHRRIHERRMADRSGRAARDRMGARVGGPALDGPRPVRRDRAQVPAGGSPNRGRVLAIPDRAGGRRGAARGVVRVSAPHAGCARGMRRTQSEAARRTSRRAARGRERRQRPRSASASHSQHECFAAAAVTPSIPAAGAGRAAVGAAPR